MGNLELEGDSVSPLARFDTKTKWGIWLVSLTMLATIGSVFALLSWINHKLVSHTSVWVSIPGLLCFATFLLVRFAHKAGEVGDAEEVQAVAFKVLRAVAAFITVFFYMIFRSV